MNINKLKELLDSNKGELVVKNYPTLCEILEIKKASGNTKISQFKELATHCNYEQQGQKIIVKEIYDTQKEKIDMRGAKGKFSDDLQEILLGVLAQDKKGELLFSKNVLFKHLNMINDNYRIARYNVPQLSELIEVDEDIVYSFFDDANSKMVDMLEVALKRLRSRRLIIWEKVMVVAKLKAIKNELGEVKLEFDNDNYNNARVKTQIEYRQATFEEKQIILEIERSIMNELGCKDAQQVFLNGKWREYKKKVNALVQERLNIKFHFEGFLITYNHDRIVEEAIENTSFLKINVNNNLVESFINNANTRNQNAINKQINIEEYNELIELHTKEELKARGIKGARLSARDKVSLKDTFVEDTSIVVNTLIKSGAKNIIDDIRELNNK